MQELEYVLELMLVIIERILVILENVLEKIRPSRKAVEGPFCLRSTILSTGGNGALLRPFFKFSLFSCDVKIYVFSVIQIAGDGFSQVSEKLCFEGAGIKLEPLEATFSRMGTHFFFVKKGAGFLAALSLILRNLEQFVYKLLPLFLCVYILLLLAGFYESERRISLKCGQYFFSSG